MWARAKYGTWFIAALLAGVTVFYSGHNGDIQVKIGDALELVEGLQEKCRPVMVSWPDVHTSKVVSVVFSDTPTNYVAYHQDGTHEYKAYVSTNYFVTNSILYTNWTKGFHYTNETAWSIGRLTNGVAYSNGPSVDTLPIQVHTLFASMAAKWRDLVPQYVDDVKFGNGTDWYAANPSSNSPPMLTVSNVLVRNGIGNLVDKFSFETNSPTVKYIDKRDFLEMQKAIKALKWTAKSVSWNRYIRDDPSFQISVQSANSNAVNGQAYPPGYPTTNRWSTDNISALWPDLFGLLVNNFTDESVDNAINWNPAATNNGSNPYLLLSASATLKKESWETIDHYDVYRPGLWSFDCYYYTNREYRTSISGQRRKSESIYSKFPSEVSVVIDWYAYTVTNGTKVAWESFSSKSLDGSSTTVTSDFCLYPDDIPTSLTLNWTQTNLLNQAQSNQSASYVSPTYYFLDQASIGTNATQGASLGRGVIEKNILPAIEKWTFIRCID